MVVVVEEEEALVENVLVGRRVVNCKGEERGVDGKRELI